MFSLEVFQVSTVSSHGEESPWAENTVLYTSFIIFIDYELGKLLTPEKQDSHVHRIEN